MTPALRTGCLIRTATYTTKAHVARFRLGTFIEAVHCDEFFLDARLLVDADQYVQDSQGGMFMRGRRFKAGSRPEK